MLRAIEQCQTNISKVFLTHAHKNHISCIGDIPIYLHESDKELFEANIPDDIRGSSDVHFIYLLNY